MPKALLVNPRPLEHEMLDAVSIPFSVLYLGTFLKAHGGWDVKVVDGMTAPSDRAFRAEVLEHARGADLVGFSVMTPHIADALEATRLLKRERPGATVLWGGVHPTLFPEETLAAPEIDLIVYGEGEEPLLALARALEAGADLSSVPSLGYKAGGRVRLTPAGAPTDFARIPMPDYGLLDRFERYVALRKVDNRKYVRERLHYATIHCGRGCPYDCAFCINTVYDDPRLRRHRAFPAERTYAEMRWFCEAHGVEYLSLQDELFFVNKPRLDALLALLEERPLGVRWDANPRVNFFNEAYLTDEYLERMRATGFDDFCLAAESGSPRVLRILKKNIRIEQTVEAIGRVHRHGMRVSTGFMIGIPGEEIEDMYASLRLGIRLYEASEGEIYFIGPQIFRPFPGAELFERAKAHGLRTPESLEEWATVAVNPYFGFLQVDYLPWLDREKRRHINFIVKYFTIVLGTRFDRTLLSIPLRAVPVAALLHLLLRLRTAFGEYDRFWAVERTILNAVTPLENGLRRLRYLLRRLRRRAADSGPEAAPA